MLERKGREDYLQRLIWAITREGAEGKPGPAHEVMTARNLWRGFEAAHRITNALELRKWFHDEVVSEYTGPWEPREAALDGVLFAISLHQTKLTHADIAEALTDYMNFSLPKKGVEIEAWLISRLSTSLQRGLTTPVR